MDISTPIKNTNLVQHNLLTMARYQMSAAEKDIVYMLLAQLEESDAVDKIYYIYIKDIEKITSKEINYCQVHNATKRLISKVYSIQDGDDILQVSMISSARYLAGTGKVAIRIDPEIRPYIFGLKKNFTKYGLFMAMAVRSIYSKRMYEMLNQFKSTGVMRISIKELKNRLNLIDEKSGKEKYTIWKTFIRKVLEVAKSELSERTDISFTYEAKKTGRKFTDLEFKISYIPQQYNLKFEEDPTSTSIYKRLTEDFRLSSWQSNLVIAYVPAQEIHKTLYEIQLKKINSGLNNIGGFTAQTFENKYQLGLMGQHNSRYGQHNASQQEDKYPVKRGREKGGVTSSDNILSIGDHINQLQKKE